MASTTASAGAPAAASAKPRTQRASRLAALRADRYRTLQLVLFALGAVLMPFGILAIALGWYGTAHAHYDYDQRTYLISGGIMGLGLTFVGGFLYFGAWLAKVGADQRDSNRQLSEALTAIAEALHQRPGAAGSEYNAEVIERSDTLVFAGEGTTVHRRDCPLIAHRTDLRETDGRDPNATPCRVCRPVVDEEITI
jgi:hypothetical protein